LAFYADDDEFALPSDYVVSSWTENGTWVKIEGQGDELVANGVASVEWKAISTSKLMLSFTQAAGKRTRLVEFKAF
jgi:hypothetical protein